jgi:putative SOS response-associated peptidase YedK
MCGRYTSYLPPEAIRRTFQVQQMPNFPPSWNVAPTQAVPVVRLDREQERELTLMRWGLIPYWAKDKKIGYKLINARAESVQTSNAFREAYKRRHCLVVADGFYEWKPENGKKQPYYIRLKTGEPFGFAGLWENWTDKDSGEKVQSCTILRPKPMRSSARSTTECPLFSGRTSLRTGCIPRKATPSC